MDEPGDRCEKQHERGPERHQCRLLGTLAEDAEAIRRQEQSSEGLAAKQRLDLAVQLLGLTLEGSGLR